MIDSILSDIFWGFVLQYLTGCMFECDIADRRRSVAVLCMLDKIRCNSMHPLHGALPVPYVPVRVTRGTLGTHRYTYAPPRSIAGLLFLFPRPCGTILLTPCSLVWRVSRAGPMLFLWNKLLDLFLSSTVFPFSSFFIQVDIVGLGSLD